MASTLLVPPNYKFDTDSKRDCVDTGASACLAKNKKSFVQLQTISNVKINGIGSGLVVEGIGVLKWSLRDDKNNEIDMFIDDAL
jgi:hypothetical protein